MRVVTASGGAYRGRQGRARRPLAPRGGPVAEGTCVYCARSLRASAQVGLPVLRRNKKPMPRGEFHKVRMRTILAVAMALTAPPAVAADSPASPSQAPVTTSPAAPELGSPAELPHAGPGSSTQAGIAGCAVWTDRCVICERASGIITCSNIGISCQPQLMVCLRTEAVEEKKPEGDTPPAQPERR